MQERAKDSDERVPQAAPKRRYAPPRLKVHGSVETVTQRGRGHDKPKHTKHPPQHP